jgi:hypothetical protein
MPLFCSGLLKDWSCGIFVILEGRIQQRTQHLNGPLVQGLLLFFVSVARLVLCLRLALLLFTGPGYPAIILYSSVVILGDLFAGDKGQKKVKAGAAVEQAEQGRRYKMSMDKWIRLK